MNSLENKNIIVTGASGGIGNSIVEKLYKNEANILATGTRIEKLDELRTKFNKIKILKNNKNIVLFKSLGVNNYYNFLKFADIVIGNSSSGIIEAPLTKTPTINIGTRQEGRVFSKSIFNVPLSCKLIKDKIKEVLDLRYIYYQSLFYKKNTSKKISDKIFNLLDQKREIKSFKDITSK